MFESPVGTIDVAAAEEGHNWKVHLARHVRLVRRHLGRHSEAVDTDLDIAVEADGLERSLVHGHGSGSLDVVHVGETEPAVDDIHGSMDKHSHGREVLVVPVLGDIVDWMAGCWVERKGHSEANAQSEMGQKAEASGRLERAVVQRL